MALADWGNQVLELLKKGLGERPLIFIIHSMGIGLYTIHTAPSPKGERSKGFRRGCGGCKCLILLSSAIAPALLSIAVPDATLITVLPSDS
jgi:predicted alpha/beta hydrolase